MKRFQIGPGILITAAFIGPGTLTVCSIAGVRYDLNLLWALLLSVLITGFLQLLVARLSWTSGLGLVAIVQQQTPILWIRNLLLALVGVAIFLGNTAYEAGNLSGALMGLDSIFPTAVVSSSWYTPLCLFVLGSLLGFLLWKGHPAWIKSLLLAVVIVMSVSFLVTAVWVRPDWGILFNGLFIPKVPENSLFTIMALIGTTVVPYNLFLHAALVKDQSSFTTEAQLRKDTLIAVGLGGLISLCIIISAAANTGQDIQTVVDMGKALEPLYGSAATFLVGVGLFAAGISSALTAPLAAGFVAQEVFGWSSQSSRTKAVRLGVFLFGLAALGASFSPTRLIQLAQIANALLLPFISLFLLYLLRKMKTHRLWQWGLLVALVVFLGLAVKTFVGMMH